MDAWWPVLLVAVVAIGGVVAVLANRRSGASHRPVDVGGLGFEQGLVVFTSTDCTDCTTVMRTVRDQDVYVREVTFELESKLFEAAGVVGVPLLVGVDEHGATVGQLAGVPTERELSRLITATR